MMATLKAVSLVSETKSKRLRGFWVKTVGGLNTYVQVCPILEPHHNFSKGIIIVIFSHKLTETGKRGRITELSGAGEQMVCLRKWDPELAMRTAKPLSGCIAERSKATKDLCR